MRPERDLPETFREHSANQIITGQSNGDRRNRDKKTKPTHGMGKNRKSAGKSGGEEEKNSDSGLDRLKIFTIENPTVEIAVQILLSEPRFCLCNSTQRGSRSVPDMASGRSNSALWINPEDPLGYRPTLKLSLVTNHVLNSGTPPRNPQRRSRHYPFSPTGFFFFAHCSPALCAKKRTELHAGNTRAHRCGTRRSGRRPRPAKAREEAKR